MDDSYLIDAGTGEQRFRIEKLLASGRSYEIVLAADTHDDDRLVCAKAVSYDRDRLDEADYVEGRREALEAEVDALASLDSPLLPEVVCLFRASSPEAGFEDEPVLVYDYVEGDTLYERIQRDSPEGAEPDWALGILRDLVQFLLTVHNAGYVFRDLDPRHVIIDDSGDVAGVVGFGNLAARGERPNEARPGYDDAPYVAPEARSERSGKMLKPTADAYALGALMSFVLTGEEPRTVVENPLNWPAYDRLSNLEPPGLALLVARLIQPHFKKRIGRMERLEPFVQEDGLPTTQTKGFGMLLLPAPFSGVEDPENNRALKSKLSSGPLISTDSAHPAAPEMTVEEPDGMPITWMVAALGLAVVTVLVLTMTGVL